LIRLDLHSGHLRDSNLLFIVFRQLCSRSLYHTSIQQRLFYLLTAAHWVIGSRSFGSISMKAAKPKIGVRSPEAASQEKRGRRKEPEEVFLQI
ncbi:hypothetical protein, partial [Microcoleus vaginatus]|uniref:hypothetical protein n=1 Tax=Microcoleus vaginatus TaxID=119532 RepID=UPI0032A2D2D1